MTALSPTWLVEALLASTLLMTVVLALRYVVTPLFGARISYILWALPVLRMVLPPLPRSESAYLPTGLDLSVIHQIAPVASSVASIPAAQSSAAAISSIDWGMVVMAVWVLGAVVHFSWHLVAYRIFLSRTEKASAPLYDISGVKVYSADVSGPAAAGVFLRRILLPRDFGLRFEEREQRLALAHELAHHRRGDLLANWVALLLLSLHWFNPVAHAAYRAFRDDQELACDATVLTASSSGQMHAYASAIVKATWDRGVVAACPLNQAGQLKRRLKMMRLGRSTLMRSSSGLVLTACMVSGGLAMTASGVVTERPAVAKAINTLMAAPAAIAESSRNLEPMTSVRELRDALSGEVGVSDAYLLLPEGGGDAPTAAAAADFPFAEAPAVSAPAERTVHYTLVGSPTEYVVPASKATVLSLLLGRGFDGEPVEIQKLSVTGLSREEAAALTTSSRAAGSLSNVAAMLAQTDAAYFEARAAGDRSFNLQVAWDRSPPVTLAPIPAPAAPRALSLPSAKEVRAEALVVGRHVSERYRTATVRSVYAVPVSGALNDAIPGRAYIGFCGLINTQGRGARAQPFFASNMPSNAGAEGQTHVLFGEQAAVRCKGSRSNENYAAVFRNAVAQRNYAASVTSTATGGALYNLTTDPELRRMLLASSF